MALRMVSAQGGIFGWVSEVASVRRALLPDSAPPP